MIWRLPVPPWLMGTAIAFAAYALYQSLSGPATLESAVRDRTVEARIEADDPQNNSVTVTVSRPIGSSGTITVQIPAGTLLHPLDRTSQRLMTTIPVTIVLPDGSNSTTVTVKTVCIDPFAPQPPTGAGLALAAPVGAPTDRTEETDPIRKLVACMSDHVLSDAERQITVWAVSAQLLNNSADDARRYVTEGLVQRMQAERRNQLEAKRAEAHAMAPSLSDQKISELIEQEYQQSLPTIQAVAADTSAKLLEELRTRDREVLSDCGYRVADLAIFN